MSVLFSEVSRNSSFDAHSKRFPAMIVPLGASNMIQVLGAKGLGLFDDKGILQIKELNSSAIIMDKLLAYKAPLVMSMLTGDLNSAYALQLKMATKLALPLAGNPRFFQITGKGLGGKDGSLVRAAKTRKSKEAEGYLQVIVLKQRPPLKLAIRPVQVRDKQRNPVFHCESNFDAKVLLERINAIWITQANVVFELASSAPAMMDDEVAIAKALGGWSQKATLPPIVEFDDFKGMFQELKDKGPKADFTIFLVHRLNHGGEAVFGTINIKGGYALVSDGGRAEDQTTMAHEIGHYFGTLAKGKLYDDDNSKSSQDLLMGPGNGVKIPVEDVITYFNTNYK